MYYKNKNNLIYKINLVSKLDIPTGNNSSYFALFIYLQWLFMLIIYLIATLLFRLNTRTSRLVHVYYHLGISINTISFNLFQQKEIIKNATLIFFQFR